MKWHRQLTAVTAALVLLTLFQAGSLAEQSAGPLKDYAEISCGIPTWPESPPPRPAGLVTPPDEYWLADWEEGPNFACTARLMATGCGSGCVSGVLYDAASDVWLSLPFAIHRDSAQREALLDFAIQGDILTATGWLNEELRGVFRFHWDGRRLRRLSGE